MSGYCLELCLFHQLCHRLIQGGSDFPDVYERQIVFTSLDAAHLGAVNPCLVCQSFLGQAHFQSGRTNSLAESG